MVDVVEFLLVTGLLINQCYNKGKSKWTSFNKKALFKKLVKCDVFCISVIIEHPKVINSEEIPKQLIHSYTCIDTTYSDCRGVTVIMWICERT